MNSDVSIERADSARPREFWDQVARLHQQEIREGFLSTMGREFLARLYAAVVRCDRTLLLVATHNDTGAVVGFICGATNTGQVLKNCIWRSGISIVLPVLPRLLSWRTAVRALETLRYARSDRCTTLPRAEILNFCVDGNQQGLGIGRRLFAALTEEFRRRGIDHIKIVTGESQASAQNFYDSVHARRLGSVQVHEGAKSVVYVYEIS